MTPQGARTSTLDKLLYRNRLCQRATRTAARGQQAVLQALALDITAATTTRSCLVLAPHPDDETLGAGGLLARLARDGVRCDVIVLTDGEGSHPDSPTHTPARLAATCEDRGVHLIDAPVSGGSMGAATGNLALMVGGSDEAVAIVREPFACIAGLVAHLGPVGAGTRAKLARNLITFAAFAAVGEALALANLGAAELRSGWRDARRVAALRPTALLLPYAVLGPVALLAGRLVLP